jgi:hypothetical protein
MAEMAAVIAVSTIVTMEMAMTVPMEMGMTVPMSAMAMSAAAMTLGHGFQRHQHSRRGGRNEDQFP